MCRSSKEKKVTRVRPFSSPQLSFCLVSGCTVVHVTQLEKKNVELWEREWGGLGMLGPGAMLNQLKGCGELVNYLIF